MPLPIWILKPLLGFKNTTLTRDMEENRLHPVFQGTKLRIFQPDSKRRPSLHTSPTYRKDSSGVCRIERSFQSGVEARAKDGWRDFLTHPGRLWIRVSLCRRSPAATACHLKSSEVPTAGWRPVHWLPILSISQKRRIAAAANSSQLQVFFRIRPPASVPNPGRTFNRKNMKVKLGRSLHQIRGLTKFCLN